MLTDIFTFAAEITEKIMGEDVSLEPTPSLPVPSNLAKAANCHRQHHHPQDPTTLNFELAEDHIPEGFLYIDVTIGHRHHLIFATDKMFELLFHSKSWFTPANFKVISSPSLSPSTPMPFLLWEAAINKYLSSL